jgi:peptidoglycan hydrolase CwlO-like protein
MFGYKIVKENSFDDNLETIKTLTNGIEERDKEIKKLSGSNDRLNLTINSLSEKIQSLKDTNDELNLTIESLNEKIQSLENAVEASKPKTTRRRKVTKKTNDE